MTILFTPFALFLPGYLLLKLIWGKNEKLNFWEAMILGVALSFLLAYPLGIANNIIEYFYSPQPYQVHIDTLFPLYLFLCGGLHFFSRKKKTFHDAPAPVQKKWLFLILSIFGLAILLRLYGNAYQNINQDEQELSLYSYNLIDGILVGRKAFFISSTVHSPLGFFISFIIYQLIVPFGYFYSPEYIVRSPMIVFGILELALFLLFAKRLKISKPITAFGLLLLAINTYAIFGSRLMIPQDGSIFSFFVLLFSYFYIRFLEKDGKPTKLDIFLIGLLAASTVLVKLAAIFLIPPLLLFWFIKKKSTGNLFKTLLIALLFFSPVILFNIISYNLTGYTDVPTAKLLNFLGIHANSIMNNEELYGAIFPPFFKTIFGFLEMLADQWSLPISLNFFISIPLYFIFRKKINHGKSIIQFFLALLFTSLLFFSLNGYRAYYAEYLTLPLLLISMVIMEKIQKKNIILKITFVLWAAAYALYSFLYTVNTHVFVIQRPDYLTTGEFGRFDLYSYDQFKQHRSLASWSFLRDDGFPALAKYLNGTKELIVIEDDFIDNFEHHFRWYLGIHRDVSSYYLGAAYKDDYNYTRLGKYDYSVDAIEIIEYSPEKIKADDVLIYNHNGRPKIIIRYLKKTESLSPAPSTRTS